MLKQLDVSFSCICPVSDHEFHLNVVQVAGDRQSNSGVDLQTDVNFFLTIRNCHTVHSHSLTYGIDYNKIHVSVHLLTMKINQ